MKFTPLVQRFIKNAIPFYKNANDFNPNNSDLNMKLGECYLESVYKYKALAHLKKAVELNRNITPYAHFFIGKSFALG